MDEVGVGVGGAAPDPISPFQGLISGLVLRVGRAEVLRSNVQPVQRSVADVCLEPCV